MTTMARRSIISIVFIVLLANVITVFGAVSGCSCYSSPFFFGSMLYCEGAGLTEAPNMTEFKDTACDASVVITIRLDSNQITNFKAWENVTFDELESLQVRDNLLTSLDGLGGKNFPYLTEIHADGNQITQVKGFCDGNSSFPVLNELQLFDNPIEDVAYLQNCSMPNLVILGLDTSSVDQSCTAGSYLASISDLRCFINRSSSDGCSIKYACPELTLPPTFDPTTNNTTMEPIGTTIWTFPVIFGVGLGTSMAIAALVLCCCYCCPCCCCLFGARRRKKEDDEKEELDVELGIKEEPFLNIKTDASSHPESDTTSGSDSDISDFNYKPPEDPRAFKDSTPVIFAARRLNRMARSQTTGALPNIPTPMYNEESRRPSREVLPRIVAGISRSVRRLSREALPVVDSVAPEDESTAPVELEGITFATASSKRFSRDTLPRIESGVPADMKAAALESRENETEGDDNDDVRIRVRRPSREFLPHVVSRISAGVRRLSRESLPAVNDDVVVDVSESIEENGDDTRINVRRPSREFLPQVVSRISAGVRRLSRDSLPSVSDDVVVDVDPVQVEGEEANDATMRIRRPSREFLPHMAARISSGVRRLSRDTLPAINGSEFVVAASDEEGRLTPFGAEPLAAPSVNTVTAGSPRVVRSRVMARRQTIGALPSVAASSPRNMPRPTAVMPPAHPVVVDTSFFNFDDTTAASSSPRVGGSPRRVFASPRRARRPSRTINEQVADDLELGMIDENTTDSK